MHNQLRDVIATDIPLIPAPGPARAPLEIYEDLTRRDAWMFAPLIATALLGLSVWHLATEEASATKPPTTFASRWPEHEMPTVTR